MKLLTFLSSVYTIQIGKFIDTVKNCHQGATYFRHCTSLYRRRWKIVYDISDKKFPDINFLKYFNNEDGILLSVIIGFRPSPQHHPKLQGALEEK